MKEMIYADALLARRLEAAEAANARGCSAAPPGVTAAVLEVARRVRHLRRSRFAALTHAVGLGLDGPVGAQALDLRIETFFRSARRAR